MKMMMVLGVSALFAMGTAPVSAFAGQGSIAFDQTVEHGGGCRKSSPPGQCCHMDRKAGTVHCH
ncbi:MAG: hypothetical protein JJ871_11110 [Thalassospira sp.]|uniref:hypothetical protein n=1 Tax=Thalassospira sp. TaxID=1912094 RepID=UPI001B066A6D|nr:hypothetical protein [Thalassospira sp.]MBO6579822.1 hypothetical protein [Thalassospira sp.]MBO6819597.1 hypothetical protein [Thalassospira sp.]MBO6888606.1 hypothetical protein [Thalassospira sp.]